MANNTLAEYLQFHGQENTMGCLSVRRNGETGKIYLHHGHVVYAEKLEGTGLYAFFSMLGWSDAEVDWVENQSVPRILFEEPVDTLLFQFAQLEDSGQTDDTSLRNMFEAKSTGGVKLTEIKSYLISFDVSNADFNPFTFTLKKDITLVGRAEDCDVVLPDATISSHHCTITQEPNCIRITDLGSTNGSRINGELITDSIVQIGDELMLGKVVLRMAMRMQRHLAVAGEMPAEKADAPLSSAKKATTMKLDQKMMRDPSGKKAPISWKTIEEEPQKPKPNSGGLFGKLFKK